MDTLKAYEKLRSKFDDDTARVMVETLAEFVSPSLDKLATREDIARLEGDIGRLERTMATKEELALVKAELRTEIQAAKVETIRWMMGIGFSQLLALIGLIIAILTRLH